MKSLEGSDGDRPPHAFFRKSDFWNRGGQKSLCFLKFHRFFTKNGI